MSDAARPELAALQIGDPPERWEALGFTVTQHELVLGGVSIRLGGAGTGITGWSVRHIPALSAIDGLPAIPAPASVPVSAPPPAPASAPVPGSAPAPGHANGASGIDHVVVVTPDFDRTAAALQSAGMPLRRLRAVGGDPRADAGAFRQGFRRLGPAILELVEAKGAPAGPAAFWGLVVVVEDLEALGARLGDHLSPPKPAVQPGRRIATLRASAELSPRVAFMDAEPAA